MGKWPVSVSFSVHESADSQWNKYTVANHLLDTFLSVYSNIQIDFWPHQHRDVNKHTWGISLMFDFVKKKKFFWLYWNSVRFSLFFEFYFVYVLRFSWPQALAHFNPECCVEKQFHSRLNKKLSMIIIPV